MKKRNIHHSPALAALSSIIFPLSLGMMLASCADEADTSQLLLSGGYMSVSTTEMTLSGGGQSQNVSITANCAWSVSTDADWLTVSPMSGTASTSINISASQNSSVTSQRTATVTVSTADGLRRTIHVRQEKNDETLRFNAEALTFAAAGEAKSLVIESNAEWEIMGASDWLTLSATTGKGNAEITITAQANPLETERTATLTVKGTTLSDRVAITQEGRATTLAVSPTELVFAATQEHKAVELVGDASWQASSSAEWLTLSQTEGVGAATLTLSAADNATLQPRTATVTIKTLRLELTISISQEAGQLPVLTTPVSAAIGRENFDVASSVTSMFAVTAVGFCYSSTNGEPTTADTRIDLTAGSNGNFSTTVSGLTSHATYYVRAYATSKAGTAYSPAVTVTTEGSVPGDGDNVKPNL